MTETSTRDRITAALARAARDNDGTLTVELAADVAVLDLTALAVDLEQLQDDHEQLRQLHELLQRQYPEQVGDLRKKVDQWQEAHRSAQRALVRVETERDELRRAIATAAGLDPDLINTLDTDYLGLLATLTDRQTDSQTSSQTAR
ncbi:hypothetical protein [Lentzea sp. NBRC 102530]|uniref:hypothetical protein n=1 Tax=Lentzea sp. NBRC 102530 TaxID=3032201 RepID=UPI0025565F75|nr:hypothetical protein [Lentzea sp. NBRC 102530]